MKSNTDAGTQAPDNCLTLPPSLMAPEHQQEADLQLSRYFDCAPGIFFTLCRDADGALSMPFVGGRMLPLLGLTAQSVAADISPLLALCHPDDASLLLAELARSFQSMSPVRVELRMTAPASASLVMACSATPHRVEGQPGTLEWHGFLSDVGERMHPEAELVRREREVRALADSLPAAVIVYDTSFRRRYINPAAQRILHGTADNMLGLEPGQGGVPATPEMIRHYRSKMEAVMASNAMCDFEFSRDALPEGQQEHYEVRMTPEYGNDGKVRGVLAIWFDITGRKYAQKRMELLERAIDMSSDAIYLHDEQLRFNYVNTEACHRLGYSREELLAMGPHDIDHDLTRETIQEMMNASPVGSSIMFETSHP
jgi:PAS domain S-box-containing protein